MATQKEFVFTSVSTPLTVFSSGKSRCSLKKKKKVFTSDSTSINVQFYNFSRPTKIPFATHQWVTTHSLRTTDLDSCDGHKKISACFYAFWSETELS